MLLQSLDHLVLTVKDIEKTCSFYCGILGMEKVAFAGGRTALVFGSQKINLHEQGHEFEPKAFRPTPGSADLCFISATPLAEVIPQLVACGVEILEGPVRRTGAQGDITSIYMRDPDMNLVEISSYDLSDASERTPVAK